MQSGSYGHATESRQTAQAGNQRRALPTRETAAVSCLEARMCLVE